MDMEQVLKEVVTPKPLPPEPIVESVSTTPPVTETVVNVPEPASTPQWTKLDTIGGKKIGCGR